MKKLFAALLIFFLATVIVYAQQDSTFTLDQMQELAKNNYPLIKQKELINQSSELNNKNLNRNYLPQLSINGQASYQSDVTKIPISFPGLNIETPDKDQYKITADLSQIIYDGGATYNQKKIQQISALSEQEKLNVELYKLRDRVNQLYLGILLCDEQLKQTAIIQSDLDEGEKKLTAQVKNGIAYNSNLFSIQAEGLKNNQHKDEINSNRNSLLRILSLLIGKELSSGIALQMPVVLAPSSTQIAREELKLFTVQDSLLGSQSRLIAVKNRPKFYLFAQGGYGRPGLNLLNNDFDSFYIGGVKLNWSLGGLYTSGKEKRLNAINRNILDSQKQLFILNTNATLQQNKSDIEKLNSLLKSDDEIIQLRNKIKAASNAQLANSVITSADYIREVNAADQANQNKIIHQLQLIQAELNYQYTLGN